jgi:tRNA U54 and U55 pseudouridine synthase Pus10
MAAHCKDCNSTIDEAKEATLGRLPCPVCGSLARKFEEAILETMTLGTDMQTKAFTAGLSRRKGLRFESKDGDSFSVSLGRFVKRYQLVNHEAKRYVKKVVDPLTGEVLRDVDEPLPDHQNRGSARERDT